jgi:hypothetical protein
MKNFRILKNAIVFNQVKLTLNSNFITLANYKKPTFSKQVPHYSIKSNLQFLSIPGKLYLGTIWLPTQKYAKIIYKNVYLTPNRLKFITKFLNKFFTNLPNLQLIIFFLLLSNGKNSSTF